MTVGTKSLLFGSHQFIVHPLMVAWAWRQLYGRWPAWREWVCIIIHDWGYWSLPNMDGPEGDTHPEWAASVAGRWLGPEYAALCRYHSRFLARRDGRNVSRLCAPDKLAGGSWPVVVLVFLCSLTGEIDEYMARVADPNGKHKTISAPPTAPPVESETRDKSVWYRQVAAYLCAWAWEHRDGRYDTWTQGEQRSAVP